MSRSMGATSNEINRDRALTIVINSCVWNFSWINCMENKYKLFTEEVRGMIYMMRKSTDINTIETQNVYSFCCCLYHR